MSEHKCPHCEYYMWEGKEFYECNIQDKVDRLLKTLQEIKAIAEKEIYMKQNSSMNRILELIIKAESEG